MRSPPIPLTALVALSLAIAACGGDRQTAPSATTTGPRSQAAPVAIDLWHSETASNLETLDRLVSRFNSSQSEVTVRLSYQGVDEEAMAKLVASVRSGEGPAIAILAEVFTREVVDSGAVAPVQDFIDREGYDLSSLVPSAVQYFVVDGKLWGMPLSMSVPLLYYNKVTFREAGLDPERPPSDLDEVRQYSERILKRDESGQVVRSGIAIDVQEWLERVLAEHGDLFLDNANGREGRATEVLFDSDSGRRFFQWWHDMVDQGLAINVGRNPSYAEGFLAISSGRAAMTFSYSPALRSVVDALDAGVEGVEIGVGRLPGVPGGTGASVLLGRGIWLLNVRPEREQEAAWKFVKWLMEPEQQAEWFAGSGSLPVSRAAVDLPAAQEIVKRYPQFQAALDVYLGIPATAEALGPLLGPYRQVNEAVSQAVEEMLAGSKDPVQALDDAAARSNEVIAEYNRRLGR